MLIDLHMHESTYSADSFLSLDEIVAIAQKRGLEGICVTDHDSMGLKGAADAFSRETGFPIFTGVEYYSSQGDIVAFGIDDIPEKRIDAQDFIDRVKRQGGVCFSAHPFRDNNRGLEENLLRVRGLDGIEAFNGSASFEANLKALEYCGILGLQPLGASDCHVPEKVGVYATRLPDTVSTMDDFLRSFRKGLCRPMGYIDGAYVDLILHHDKLSHAKPR